MIHVFSVRACYTVWFFLLECLKTEGKRWASVALPHQEECQKGAVAPSPTVTVVAAAKRAHSPTPQWTSEPTHGRSGCCQVIHNHCKRRAVLKHCRPWTPRPHAVGKHMDCQLTLQLPPEVSSSCRQRKRRLHLSTSLNSFFGACSTFRAKVGMALRTHHTITLRPENGMSMPSILLSEP